MREDSAVRRWFSSWVIKSPSAVSTQRAFKSAIPSNDLEAFSVSAADVVRDQLEPADVGPPWSARARSSSPSIHLLSAPVFSEW